MKDYNLDQSYFDPLLNIVEDTVNLLNNFNRIKLSRYHPNKIEKTKKRYTT